MISCWQGPVVMEQQQNRQMHLNPRNPQQQQQQQQGRSRDRPLHG
jgi:hypothetical protein